MEVDQVDYQQDDNFEIESAMISTSMTDIKVPISEKFDLPPIPISTNNAKNPSQNVDLLPPPLPQVAYDDDEDGLSNKDFEYFPPPPSADCLSPKLQNLPIVDELSYSSGTCRDDVSKKLNENEGTKTKDDSSTKCGTDSYATFPVKKNLEKKQEDVKRTNPENPLTYPCPRTLNMVTRGDGGVSEPDFSKGNNLCATECEVDVRITADAEIVKVADVVKNPVLPLADETGRPKFSGHSNVACTSNPLLKKDLLKATIGELTNVISSGNVKNVLRKSSTGLGSKCKEIVSLEQESNYTGVKPYKVAPVKRTISTPIPPKKPILLKANEQSFKEFETIGAPTCKGDIDVVKNVVSQPDGNEIEQAKLGKMS